ncbi:MAG: tartrate-resistant acid phosphatase type 5 family protein [Rhodothermales bacterium]|nr:tartrate-resistant acid phosphatase type 5 family protein [Rhodothermales bacterium]
MISLRSFRGLCGCLAGLLLFAACDASPDSLYAIDEPLGADPQALTFLAVGDWGRDGAQQQDEVAGAMAVTAEAIEADFVISTGDNFYPDGVSSTRDDQWRTSFEEVYQAPALQVPWYAVLGNHDYRSDPDAQVAYTALSDRWTMPARYYAVEYAVDDTTAALFLFLDTVSLVQSDEAEDAFGARVAAAAQRQLRWADSTLTASEAAWKIVVGHHPVRSASRKHADPPELERGLRPLLERHGVAVYLSGHVHSLQHIEPAGGVHYFVSGAGSSARLVGTEEGLRFAAGVPGFMAGVLTPRSLAVYFIDHSGVVGYATEVPRP